MIKSLEVKNFKSIKQLELNCKRINVFIGEPNTGKSNILESLGILSFGMYESPLSDFVRLEKMNNLFYDENLDEKIEIKFNKNTLEVNFKDGKFKGEYVEQGIARSGLFDFDYYGSGSRLYLSTFSPFKFYRFPIGRKDFPNQRSDFLLPPAGVNLLAVLMSHKEIKSTTEQIFGPFGLKLVFKPQENRIEVLKQIGDTLVLYPYFLTSETLQRIIFYLTAINSNKDSILILEEPESHAFPYYTKLLAEKIALDKNNNQYFISTHNPYFLLSVLEKSPKDEVGIFITYFKDYQTKIKLLNEEEMEEIMTVGIDIFFNIERFLEK